jgi:hypothetical protein
MERNDSNGDYGSCKTSISIVEEIPLTSVDKGYNFISNGNFNFNERQKRIDFVLVFRNKDEKFIENSKKREIFEV